MPSFYEKSFGARLARAQNILTYLEAYPNYNPPEANQTTAALASFLDDISEANMIESQLRQLYKAAVDTRRKAFRGNSNSLRKLLPQIRGAVEAKFGKNSQEYQAASSIIKKMTAAKLVKAPVGEAEGQSGQEGNGGSGNGENGGGDGTDSGSGEGFGAGSDLGNDGENISQSQQSYGSLLGYFNELINALSEMNGYDSSNTALKVAGLQAFAVTLNTLNAAVAQKYLQLRNQRQERLGFYEELTERVQKIKAYVKAQYGFQSEQYELIKGMEV